MIIISSIQNFFDSLDNKQFYTYVAGFFGALVLIIAGILVYYYYTTSALEEQLQETNSMRKEVENLLSKMQQIERKRDDVKKMLSENANFKIAEYWVNLLSELKLTNKQVQNYKLEKAEFEDTYQEDILSANFIDMTMKELTELLEALDKTPLISTKSLDIIASKKRRNTIEVTITIATPRPKTQEVE